MVGCGLIWGACAIAVIAVLKHRRHCHRGWGHGYGGGWEAGGECGRGYGPPCGRGSGGGFRRFGLRAMVRGLFERLGTTPGQEKVIVKALEDLREVGLHAKGEIKATRKDFADAFRRGPIDEASVADIFVRHDTVISETRRKAVEAVGRIHEALDDEQRAHVADIIEHGAGHGRGYRW